MELLPGETLMRYTVILQRESDGRYVAVVPSLPGCVSRGDTGEEALKNIEEAAELYIESILACGDPLPTGDQREFVELSTAAR
jgi:predicted RNase H-like HicB family nuclease